MPTRTSNYSLWWGFARHNLGYFLSGKACLPDGHLPPDDHPVPSGLFGVCVASSSDPACDDYVVERLRELGIDHVRVDFGGDPESARLLRLLAKEGFKICLHLVQPFEEALSMHSPDAGHRWQDFVRHTVDSYGGSVEMIEIGSTCNRRRWSGLDMDAFLDAWHLAQPIVTGAGIPLAGPNVTDFEPLYNIALLGIMTQTKSLPDIHTDNLFVERVTEPERFDHRILGKALGPCIKFNLVKKARFIAAISARRGISQTQCSHVAWSLRRIDRTLPDVEEKQADYVTRYGCLAAASGALSRIYWGPLIGQREGLIDDGTDKYPDIPHVTYYGSVQGNPADYRVRPAFRAYQALIKLLPGTQYVRAPATGNGLEIHEFKSDKQIIHVAWTTNGNLALAEDCYKPESLASAQVVSRDGVRLSRPPHRLSESPVYLLWDKEAGPVTRPDAAILPDIRISMEPHITYAALRSKAWNGLVAVPLNRDPTPGLLSPERLEEEQKKNIMRNRRNCVWSMLHPSDPSRLIVVKRHQVRRWYRRLTQQSRGPRARRSWNASHELLRRGIQTSRPLAYFESTGNPALDDSYFVYDMFRSDGSIRDAFSAFSASQEEFLGLSASTFRDQLCTFLCNMHNRGVFFRDLSAGNILFSIAAGSQIEFCLIDTARARFFEQALPLRSRLSDLKRIAHPLRPEDRNAFLSQYLEKAGVASSGWMKIPFMLYNLKHAIKKILPRRRLRPR